MMRRFWFFFVCQVLGFSSIMLTLSQVTSFSFHLNTLGPCSDPDGIFYFKLALRPVEPPIGAGGANTQNCIGFAFSLLVP
jgi:hypothetical protein